MIQSDAHIKTTVRYMMDQVEHCVFAGWLNESLASILRYAESKNWVTRPSITQVYWIDYNMESK